MIYMIICVNQNCIILIGTRNKCPIYPRAISNNILNGKSLQFLLVVLQAYNTSYYFLQIKACNHSKFGRNCLRTIGVNKGIGIQHKTPHNKGFAYITTHHYIGILSAVILTPGFGIMHDRTIYQMSKKCKWKRSRSLQAVRSILRDLSLLDDGSEHLVVLLTKFWLL